MKQTTSIGLAAVILIALALAVVTLFALQAKAYYPSHQAGDRTEISVRSYSDLDIDSKVRAESGTAVANGGDGDNGGQGGDTRLLGAGGNGGDGGTGGNGGVAVSGNAQAVGTLFADINSTRIMAERCDCEETMPFGMPNFRMPTWNSNDGERVEIRVSNHLSADIDQKVMAESGNAIANGGDGDDAGSGGDVGSNRQSRNPWYSWYMWYGGSGGDGGNGGHGGSAGQAYSGNAVVDGLTDVLVNETTIRTPRNSASE